MAKPTPRAWFRSLKDHSETYPLDEIIYSASDGSLLEVAHDTDELKKLSADEWKTLNEVDNAWPGEVVSSVPHGTVARQVRVRCLRRGTEFGYSIRRLEVY